MSKEMQRVPSGAKAQVFSRAGGTAKAVPFPKTLEDCGMAKAVPFRKTLRFAEGLKPRASVACAARLPFDVAQDKPFDVAQDKKSCPDRMFLELARCK